VKAGGVARSPYLLEFRKGDTFEVEIVDQGERLLDVADFQRDVIDVDEAGEGIAHAAPHRLIRNQPSTIAPTSPTRNTIRCQRRRRMISPPRAFSAG
jgi:hypothetical protein